MQNLLDIPDTTTLTASRSMLLNNILTALSNSSGTAFPTSNLQVGMLCFRTDQNKLYQLKDATPTWVQLIDLNSLPVGNLNALAAATNLNTVTTSGFYRCNTITNGPSGLNYGQLIVCHGGSDTITQIYGDYATGTLYTRSGNPTDVGGTGAWSAWSKEWNSNNDGAGSGLDADLLDGYQSSQTATANTVAVRDANGKLAGDILGNAATATTAANATAIADGVVSTTAKLADGIITWAKHAAMNTSKLIGRTTAGTGAPEEIGLGTGLAFSGGNLTCTVTPITPKQLFSVGATVAANALTVTLDPCYIDFRSSTLTSGAASNRTVAAQISLVVPSTATLGMTNAVAAKLTILAIDNAGTVELAIINNNNGATVLDEAGLISTTAMSVTADVANTFYSTTARTNVPYRVVGTITITEATAGTWASAPTVVSGAGGADALSLESRYVPKDFAASGWPIGVTLVGFPAMLAEGTLTHTAGSTYAASEIHMVGRSNSLSSPTAGTWRLIGGNAQTTVDSNNGIYLSANGVYQRIA